MNKTIKGAIAAGSAALLLAGGAGSLAYWESSNSVGGGTIASGKLALTPVAGNGTWKNGSNTINTIASYKIVPGDTLTYTKGFTVAASGNNLGATVAVDKSSISGGLLAAGGATVTTRVLKASSPVTTLSSADDNATLTAEVTVTFPSTVSGTDFQTQSLDLSTVALKATQTVPGTSGN
jgi:alternate signal-mediated exported protein